MTIEISTPRKCSKLQKNYHFFLFMLVWIGYANTGVDVYSNGSAQAAVK